MKATIILLDGSNCDLKQWQRIYGITVGGSKIGRYFSIGEPNFDDGLTISEAVIRLLDVVRYIWNKPIFINSLDRTQADQLRLKKQGYKAAKTSPHVFKMAADIDTTSDDETLDLVDVIEEAAEILGYYVRIGYKSYMKIGQTFVHMDICPLYFAPGKIWHNEPHPIQWENTKAIW